MDLILGYKERRIGQFAEESNPALQLLRDWIVSSGNTSFSIEMLTSCLDQMKREDLVDIIQKEQGKLISSRKDFS